MRKGGVQKLKKWWVQSSFAGGWRCEKKKLGALRLQPLFKILNMPLYIDMYIKTIKVATRSARLSRHVTQECTANFQWRRKSSQNVNKDFLVVRFGNITKDFISWRRCAKMKIRYYESIRPKKSEKISLFDFQNKKNVQVRTYSRKYLDPVKLFGVQNTLFHLCTSTVI